MRVVPGDERSRFHASNHLCLQVASEPLPLVSSLTLHIANCIVGKEGLRVA